MSLTSVLDVAKDAFCAVMAGSCRIGELETRIAAYAETGTGKFPAEITSMEFIGKPLSRYTGRSYHFEADIEGMKGKQIISLSPRTAAGLLDRAVPGFARKALLEANIPAAYQPAPAPVN